ncbi:MAG TPA: hypothetical protein VGA73_11840, partial [Candidatus Binatia bacterium]
DPETQVEWVYDPVFGYRNSPAHADILRAGKIDAITSQTPYAEELEREGFPMILDPNKIFPRRPGKITVATRRTIEERGAELTAYFRAIIRSFWFMRDVGNFAYLKDLEARLRKTNTHNEDERRLSIITSPDRLDSWALPVDGGAAPEAIARIAAEMAAGGKLERALAAGEVLRGEAAATAYREVSARPELRPALATALAAVEKYGF